MSRVLDLILALAGNATTKDATATNTPANDDISKKLATTEHVKAAGRLNRVLVYRISGGVQQLSINGAAFTTTGAGTYTPATGMKFITAKVQGGGGSGGGAGSAGAGRLRTGEFGIVRAVGTGQRHAGRPGRFVTVRFWPAWTGRQRHRIECR